ncbi:MAG: amidohydrolase family protein [Pseudomonadota bacterium]|nr:amidohydrolase family protein [Pseudomonadota bacterium]
MLQLLIRQATLIDQATPVDIGCSEGRIVEVSTRIEGEAEQEIDASGRLVTTPFVDSHFHMDSTLSYGRPRVNQSGTLLEGIALWSELKPQLDAEDIKSRAHALCRWAVARGNLAIRSHVDICDPKLTAVRALLEVREELRPYLDLQLVAFPQDGYFRHPEAVSLLPKALDLGVDVVGGIPHFERTMAEGTRSVSALCEIAEKRGLMVDMHCDESDDPSSRHIETLVAETQRLGMVGRVAGSHLTSMHSMDNYYAAKLISLMAESEVHAVANPLINITLQGRSDSYPKRRGMTRVKEMIEQGINVAFGHDCVLDPWYALGSHDMLEVASMGLHVAQMTGISEMHAAFRAVTINAARVMDLADYGLTPGCNADMVVLQAGDPVEALRLKANRLYVIRRGRIIAESAPHETRVHMMGVESTVNFTSGEFNVR